MYYNGLVTLMRLAVVFGGVVFMLAVGVSSVLVWWRSMPDGAVLGRSASSAMAFEVTVPKNTPPEDVIYIYTNNQKGKRMAKTGPNTHRVELTKEQIGPLAPGDMVRYRYTRNKADFWTAEYLEPDTNDYFWTQLGRTTRFVPGQVQRDVVQRWRWFPPGTASIGRTTKLKPTGKFKARAGGQAFRSGQIIEDLFIEGFRDHFATTAAHLKEIGYTWVEIDPPWQWTEKNGWPRVANLVADNPNYPDDETLLAEIRALKAAGLRVMLGPQLCCAVLSTKDRTEAWWEAYFAETTKFLVHMAKLAERAGADAIHYAVSNDYNQADADQRWRNVFRAVRKNFSGEVGEMLWSFASTPGEIIPQADYMTWGDELDYFYIAIDTPLARGDNPTDAELKQGADKMLDGVQHLYDRYQKPVFVRTAYNNVRKSWQGNTYYDISSIPWVSDAEQELAKSNYVFGPHDQARVIQAYFRAIAERPWIIGYAQFGYTHWEYPLAADLSVRGKPSEDLWRKWNALIFAR